MFSYRTIELDLVRQVNPNALQWPKATDASDEGTLGCNRAYVDLRHLTWSLARQVLDLEFTLIARIEAAADPEEEHHSIEEELYDSDVGLLGLDLGVAAVVVGLSAAGCVPFSSCNGGQYGGWHAESHPVVAFYARRHHLGPLIQCAQESGACIGNSHYGSLVVYSGDVRAMPKMADALLRNKAAFRLPGKATAARRARRLAAGQRDLFDPSE